MKAVMILSATGILHMSLKALAHILSYFPTLPLPILVLVLVVGCSKPPTEPGRDTGKRSSAHPVELPVYLCPPDGPDRIVWSPHPLGAAREEVPTVGVLVDQ